MIFEGDRNFALKSSDVWAKLRDVRFLIECIPDASPGEQIDRDRGKCTVRPGFAFVRGSLEVALQVVTALEDESLCFRITSKGIGSSAEVETNLTIVPPLPGAEATLTRGGKPIAIIVGMTQVHWKAEIKQLGGLLKAVPTGLIRGAAQKVIEDVWTSIDERMK
jgi:carbon monoxide dehydrogenase subunit G